MRMFTYAGAVARITVRLAIVAPILFYGVFAKEQPRSTLASSIARNSVDMMPVGGIRAPASADGRHVVKRGRKP